MTETESLILAKLDELAARMDFLGIRQAQHLAEQQRRMTPQEKRAYHKLITKDCKPRRDVCQATG